MADFAPAQIVALTRELLAFLSGRLRCRAAAADLTQESWARLLAARHAGQQIVDPRALLFAAARHLAIDADRHRRIVEAHAEAARSGSAAARSAPSSEYVAAHRQLVERLAARLEALPPRRREVFVMFRVFGHSRAEVAARFRITEAAVAKHVVRAAIDCATVFAEVEAALPEPECLPHEPAQARAGAELAWQA